ncbi:MAG TPA: FecR family protein [Bdellovibrionota bacterium]
MDSHAVTGSATVVVLRGTAKTDKGKALAEKQKVDPGTTVITGARSFVRLLFPDNTQLNVGPDTTMKIEPTKAGEASLVDLVGGQIRAKVTKDPMAGKDGAPVKDKMVIKTKTAAMGIRGTDFNVSFNALNNMTALITFEGMVAMARIEGGGSPMAALQGGSGVQSVTAGQFCGAQPDMAQATVPVKISPAQLETLKGNDSFQGLGEKAKKEAAMASPVPPGVDPKGFASGSEKALKEAVAKSVGGEGKLDAAVAAVTKSEPAAKDAPPPEGFFNKATGEYAPRAGGFIDLASGRYVPPPAGSSFDANTGVFVPPKAMGTVDPSTGMYVPPKGVDLDPVKGFVAEAKPAAPADGTRAPSGTGTAAAPGAPAGAAPPPPPGVAALVLAMNTMSSPENSTKTVTLDSSFSAGGAILNPTMPPPPPPPPPGSLPPPPPNTDPQTNQPNSGNCGTAACPIDVPNNTPPTSSSVNFSINVTD